MTVSGHALERLVERYPATQAWSQNTKILRILSVLDNAYFMGIKDDSRLYQGEMKLSLTKKVSITLAVKGDTVTTVMT